MAHLKKSMGGRPRVQVDITRLERLCARGCSHAEIADWMYISKRTMERLIADEKTLYDVKGGKFTMRQIMERGYAHLRMNIRTQQLKLLVAGNATMGVWLGKQYLGQTDRLRVEEPPKDPESTIEIPVTLEELLRRRDKIVEAVKK